MNLLELGVEDASDYNSPAFEAMHHVGAVETVDIVSGGQDKIAAESLDAIYPSTLISASPDEIE